MKSMNLEAENSPLGLTLTVIFLSVSLIFKAIAIDFENVDIVLSIFAHIIQIIAAGVAVLVGYMTIKNIRHNNRNKGV